MVTIYDVAKKAGVSAATVSKVLNDYPDVSLKTIAKVQKICKEVGYRPNSVARSLVTRRSNTIGVFFTDQFNSSFRHPFLQEVMVSFKTIVGQAGFDLLFFSEESSDNEMNSYYNRARYRNVDGILIMGVPRNDPNLGQLSQSSLPCMAIDIDLFGPRAGYISSDNTNGAIEVVDYLVSLGHKHIAFIADGFSTKPGHDRLIGFRTGMNKNNLTIESEWILFGDFSEASGYNACKKILKSKNLPTAIFCAGDMMALGAMRAINEVGLKVPEDISIIGFDDLPLLAMIKPSLTTVRQNKELLGKMAGEELLKMINNPSYFPEISSEVKTKLVIRETVSRKTALHI